MRTLQSVPNIGTPTTAYPNGVIIDQTGETDGTALTELLYGDLIKAIHKIKRLATITENNLPDNETNGFQLVSALFANSLPIWQPPSGNIDFSKVKFISYNNGVYYHKTISNTTNNPAIDTTNWAVVFYWNGTKIVFADENRIAAIESAIIAVTTVQLTPHEAGYTLGQFDFAYLLRNNKVVSLYFRFTCNNPSNIILSIIPEGYRPPNSIIGVRYLHADSVSTYRNGQVSAGGVIATEVVHNAGFVQGSATWVIN